MCPLKGCHDGQLLIAIEESAVKSQTIQETAIHNLRYVAVVVHMSKSVTYIIFHRKSREINCIVTIEVLKKWKLTKQPKKGETTGEGNKSITFYKRKGEIL